MKNVVLGVGRKILQTYIEKSYSTAYYFGITKLLYQYRRFTKYLYISKETFLKRY